MQQPRNTKMSIAAKLTIVLALIGLLSNTALAIPTAQNGTAAAVFPTAQNGTTTAVITPSTNTTLLHAFNERDNEKTIVEFISDQEMLDIKDCVDRPGYEFVCCDKNADENGKLETNCMDLSSLQLNIPENGKCEPKGRKSKYRSGPWCKVPHGANTDALFRINQKGIWGRESREGKDIMRAYRENQFEGMSKGHDFRTTIEMEAKKCYEQHGGLPGIPYDHEGLGKIDKKAMTECLHNAVDVVSAESGPLAYND
ncbi:hypothetical protein BLS_005369 [Venturia inaequalis]|uniref:Uncharacterized protein n=2 Tax=Venturia inaequalis TaxID=5025 RepID=A0A8H3V460_VENIN|nr:hypothetical protein BLS_005369 [Venturia inaequalis]RDI89927.1 hypothetical protein Vi05172_g487 [Venturia inaequalis]